MNSFFLVLLGRKATTSQVLPSLRLQNSFFHSKNLYNLAAMARALPSPGFLAVLFLLTVPLLRVQKVEWLGPGQTFTIGSTLSPASVGSEIGQIGTLGVDESVFR